MDFEKCIVDKIYTVNENVFYSFKAERERNFYILFCHFCCNYIVCLLSVFYFLYGRSYY